MEPKKNGTLMEKFGFKDADLTTPKHDEIVLALNREKILEIAKLCGWKDEKVIIETIPVDYVECYGCAHEWPENYSSRKKILMERWKNKTLEAFCPILYSKMKPLMEKADAAKTLVESFNQETKIKIDYEKPIKNNGYILGFCDCYSLLATTGGSASGMWSVEEKTMDLYIEVKTSIPSFGELMRQINTYRENSYRMIDRVGSLKRDKKEGVWVVVCPDDRFAEAIRSQGVFFYKWIDTPKGQ